MTRITGFPLAAAAAGLALLGGCATKGDVEALHQEIAGLRAALASVDAKASRAEADAAKAAAGADLASEKADRIYREGLRK